MEFHRLARSANSIKVTFDGRQIGAIKSINSHDDLSPEPVNVVGDVHTQEWVPTRANYSLSISEIVFNKNSLRQLGLIPETGADIMRGLVFDIEAFDKDTGALLYKYLKCSYASGDTDVRANAVVTRNARFNALSRVGNVM